jgi:hypothetical protein
VHASPLSAFARWFVLAPSLLVVLAAATGCGASGASSAVWSASTKVAGVSSLAAVSCPAQYYCVAVGGREAVIYDGHAWSAPRPIDPDGAKGGGLSTVSCISFSFCQAGDAAGNVLTWDGTSWSAPVLVDNAGIGEISCASPRFCAAVDEDGQLLFWQGSSWTRPQVPPSGAQLGAIACTPAEFCMAVDETGADTFTFVGGSWQPSGSVNVSTPQGGSEPDTLSSVACSSSTACAVADDFGDVFTWVGRRWSDAFSFDPNLLDQPEWISCPSASFCMLVDLHGAATSWNGHRWSKPRTIDRGNNVFPASVSCASASFCMAVDTGGRAIVWRAR